MRCPLVCQYGVPLEAMILCKVKFNFLLCALYVAMLNKNEWHILKHGIWKLPIKVPNP